ncbi:hypothetical protein ACVMB0_000280 [Bradyrhizobium sp. USDA 4451]
MIAAAPRRPLPGCRLAPGKQMMLVEQRTIVNDTRLKRGLVNQKRRIGWTYNARRWATALAVIAIAAMWCTGHARARDHRAEEVLTSCRPDVMRFCERFTGRRDVDAAMFCLRDNFKSLGVECRRAMPTAADRSGGRKRRLNRVRSSSIESDPSGQKSPKLTHSDCSRLIGAGLALSAVSKFDWAGIVTQSSRTHPPAENERREPIDLVRRSTGPPCVLRGHGSP